MRIRTGTELRQELRDSRLLPTGCTTIDGELLRGGLREDHVIELCGGPGSGKTQLCLAAAAHAALRGERVLWLDGGSGFSATRMLELVAALRPGDDPGPALEGIAVAPVRSVHDVLDALAGCRGGLGFTWAGAGPTATCVGLIVCDPLHALCGSLVGGGQQHSAGAMALEVLGAELKRTAMALRCPILITNSWVGGSGPGVMGRPGLGRAWASVPHARLHLRACAGTGLDAAMPQTTTTARTYSACVLSATHVPRSGDALFCIQAPGCVAMAGVARS